ncbi:twin-arginine translocase TatA/TatE family subunit [Tsuneonella sp. HG222]
MKPGIWQIVVIALIILVLFGRGRISEMMGDFGKGIKSFKKGIAEVDDVKASSRIDVAAEDRAPVHTADKSAG